MSGYRVLLAPNPSLMTGPGTNTYLIGSVVVDPGPDIPAHVDAILAAVPHPTAIVLTHAHEDHLGAAPALRRATGAPIHAHPDISVADRVLRDGETLDLDGRRLEALFTPGHADEHISFWLPSERLVLAGDLVAGQGTVVLRDKPGALGEYLRSLERVRALGDFTLLPGHGPAIADGRAKVEEYVSHRAMRERQILDALASAPATVAALVALIYADTPSALHPMAARNVRAHLDHLAEQHKARETPVGWVQGGTLTP